MRHSARLFAIVATLLGVVALTAACGSDSDTGSSGSTDGSTSPKVIQVTFSGKSVTPNGEVVQVARGQKVELDVKADAAGEIHVHSDPEQHKEYGAGTTHLSLGSFDVPGRIEVESHALEKTIVILEVK